MKTGVMRNFQKSIVVDPFSLPNLKSTPRSSKSRNEFFLKGLEEQKISPQRKLSEFNEDQKEGGERENAKKVCDLNLVFFFAADFGLEDQTWVLAQYTISLRELKQKKVGGAASFVKEQATKSLLKLVCDENKYMRVPAAWFLSKQGDPVKWSGNIEITTNKYFNYIGAFQSKTNCYLGFMKRKESSWERFVKECVVP